MNKQAGKSAKELYKVLQQHDIDEAEIDAIWSYHFAQVDQYNEDMIDLRFELKEDLSRKEWQQLFGQP